jgi:hypothetical protein
MESIEQGRSRPSIAGASWGKACWKNLFRELFQGWSFCRSTHDAILDSGHLNLTPSDIPDMFNRESIPSFHYLLRMS